MSECTAIRHEWEAQPFCAAQPLDGFLRVVAWSKCARCRRFLCNYADFKPPLVLPPDYDLTAQIAGIGVEIARRLNEIPCPGVPVEKAS